MTSTTWSDLLAPNVQEQRLQYAVAARAQELELFWKRSLFFWGFQASAYVGYSQNFSAAPSASLVIACFGFVCAVAWTLVNRGSKYWQENWEQKVHRERAFAAGAMFSATQPVQSKGWLSAHRFSVSRVAIGLSDFSVLTWIAILVGEGNARFHWVDEARTAKTIYVGAVAFATLYGVALIYWSRPLNSSHQDIEPAA